MRSLRPLLPLLFLCACLGAANPNDETPGHGGPRLFLTDAGLFVTRIAEGYKRGALLYVQAAQPLPGSSTHPHIGIVQAMDRQEKALRVAWYCKPSAADKDLIPASGLPIEGLGQDTQARLGRCWGRYLPGASATQWTEAATVDLVLNLGGGEQVTPGDVFEVLGQPNTDPDNRIITGFQKLGTCAVLPFDISLDRALCRLDRSVARAFDREAWLRGGFVHLGQ